MPNTLEYYNQNAKEFIDCTRSLNLTDLQDKFLSYIKPGGMVLDFGCGSGRDTKYFLENGFQVEAIDGSIEFVKMASEYAQIEVKQMLFQELDELEKYDGIWACSSILHLTKEELADVFEKMERALRSKGILYSSFKYGEREGERNGRYFTDMTEEKISEITNIADLFSIEEMWLSFDKRPGKENEKWLNLILRKKR
ncbi:methyltransferase domain-containing protein [Clostridium sp. MCC353]|uniref:class I SAM-dependent methyltransferase n=1 Tax=Clostridium sp. MCC353 TaxID=2592646 RepID=UPI001C01ADE0|nr:class I SAM-dependent methyltransferase [Clostridium sp. MCC353]MBT9778606.1 methyltransferase domain-containing protein [Clostridium sp. MCC353]